MKDKIFLYSVSILVGTTVGVGIFGIPFSFAKAGFFTGFLFLIAVGLLSLAINLIFGEIILRTPGLHQFTGYVKRYSPPSLKIIATFAWFLGIYSALLAYIIISGNFLFNLFISQFYLNPFVFSILFFFFASLATLAGLKSVTRFELFMVSFFGLIVVLVFVFGLPNLELANFASFFNKEFWFLPYGVLLFAFAGFSAVPTQREILGERFSVLKKAILWGTLIPAVLYLVFAVSVVGISGETTSPDTVSGLIDFLDFRIVFLVSLFGLLAITTSFLALSWALIETFRFDYNFDRSSSWALTVFVPFLLFLLGVRNFIEVISLAGSVAIGIEGVVLVLMYKKARKVGERTPEYSLKLPNWLLTLILVLFLLGAGFALIK